MTQLYAIKAWYDNRLGMVTLEDDVLSIVRQVRELYGGRITIELDPDRGCYHFVEHCEDHTDRLIFSVGELDARALERLQGADSQVRGHEDPYDAAEREQDAIWNAQEEASREVVRSHGEELAHALKKDGVMPRLPLTVSIPRVVDDA
jgi:hypothetical protein